VVVFGVGVNIGAETAVVGVSFLGVLTAVIPVMVPDIGDFDEVEVIEVLVNAGDELSAEDSIITLESDKASMEIPTPVAGKVIDINVTLGDKMPKVLGFP
jgi:glycine cleavage system H lipoate-binding protein